MEDQVKVAPPWVTFARKVHKLFECDPEVKVEWNDEDRALKLYVNSDEKADALETLLPEEKTFGNVKMTITVIPANVEEPTVWELFQTAFKGNSAVSFMEAIDGMGFHAGYVVFQPEVVQYYNDNIADIYGIESTLYQDIAKEVFEDHAGVFFCTDIEDQKFLGKPLGEWP